MPTENDKGFFLDPNSVINFQNLIREIPANHNLTSLTPNFSISLNLIRQLAVLYLGRSALLWAMNQEEGMILI